MLMGSNLGRHGVLACRSCLEPLQEGCDLAPAGVPYTGFSAQAFDKSVPAEMQNVATSRRPPSPRPIPSLVPHRAPLRTVCTNRFACAGACWGKQAARQDGCAPCVSPARRQLPCSADGGTVLRSAPSQSPPRILACGPAAAVLISKPAMPGCRKLSSRSNSLPSITISTASP
jgi:hypothetical protein